MGPRPVPSERTGSSHVWLGPLPRGAKETAGGRLGGAEGGEGDVGSAATGERVREGLGALDTTAAPPWETNPCDWVNCLHQVLSLCGPTSQTPAALGRGGHSGPTEQPCLGHGAGAQATCSPPPAIPKILLAWCRPGDSLISSESAGSQLGPGRAHHRVPSPSAGESDAGPPPACAPHLSRGQGAPGDKGLPVIGTWSGGTGTGARPHAPVAASLLSLPRKPLLASDCLTPSGRC